MMALTFAIPRGSALRDAQLVQFPVTVGVWAIFSFALREIEIGSWGDLMTRHSPFPDEAVD
jgi:hypothetical protein